MVNGIQEKEKKKRDKDVRLPDPEQAKIGAEERQKAGSAFLKAREKALSRGASQEEATRQGEAATTGKTIRQITPEQFNIEREKKLREAGLAIVGDEEPKTSETIEIIEERNQQEAQDKISLGGFVESTKKGLSQSPTEIGGDILAATGISVGFKVGKNLFVSAKNAMQAGNAAKTAKATEPLVSGFAKFAIGGFALLKGVEGLAAYFTGRQIDEQQQAINTLGQITSTIIGDSTTGAGDVRKGVEELRFLKQEVLRLESAIKAGTISSAAVKFNGKIYDINADIADQLATIDEGIRDLQSFALQGIAPELTPQETQAQLRQLEAAGIIKPVDLTTSRRPTNLPDESPWRLF
tara:strand:+ start:567 stop:1622 length:1056 start_codon:yes stop_codon:yes gene_type:complete